MDWSQLVSPNLHKISAYKPGMTSERLQRETGLTSVLKFSSNESGITPSASIASAMAGAISNANRYPDVQDLITRLSAHLGVPNDCVILGNGSIDIISTLVRAIVSSGHNVVLSEYAYSPFAGFAVEQGARVRVALSGRHFGHDVDNLLAAVDADTRMIILDSPTNLSGYANSIAEITRLVTHLPPHVMLVLDEAYVEFIGNGRDYAARSVQLPFHYPNVVVTRTFSKAYGLAGLRIGYGIADPGLLEFLKRVRPPFPVSGIAVAAATAALSDDTHLQEIVSTARIGRARLTVALKALGLKVVDGSGNFLLTDLGTNAKRVYENLLSMGFITRPMHAYTLPTHIRISVGTAEEVDLLITAIGLVLRSQPAVTESTSITGEIL